MARVDVIVPCYNYGRFLRQCVESVLLQPGVDVRVLIIDDASSDQSKEVGEQLALEDGRVQFGGHAGNQGHIATYNEGLAWASGDYTLLLSADDLLTPGALFRAVRVMETHPEVVLSYGREIKTAYPSPETFVAPERYGWRVLSGPQFVEACCQECDNVVPTPTAVVRTAVQHRIGGYRQELPHTGDIEMWLRFAAHGSVAVLDSEQAYYRTHQKNMSLHYRGIPHLLQLRAAFTTLFDVYGRGLVECRRLYTLARRNLAAEFFWLAHRLFDRGDHPGCEACLGHALDTFPSFRHRPEWRRFQCKRLMGPRLWARVRPFVRRVRGRPRLPA